MKPVIVTWLDTTVEHGWVDSPDKLEPSHCSTMGYVVKETKEFITVAQTKCEDNEGCNLTCIPAGMILEILDLTLPG